MLLTMLSYIEPVYRHNMEPDDTAGAIMAWAYLDFERFTGWPYTTPGLSHRRSTSALTPWGYDAKGALGAL